MKNPSFKTASRRALASLAIALTSASYIGVSALPAEAAYSQPFVQAFSENTAGNIIMTGNSNETCTTSVAGTASTNCTAAKTGTPTAGTTRISNNDFGMVFVDVDADASTFNSSSAGLNIPKTATVAYAGLFWGGRVISNNAATASLAARNTVKFKTPGSTAYTTLTNQTSDFASFDANYQGYADVTELVKTAGSGNYFAANIHANTGSDQFAGWSLVVAYRDATEPVRNLTVFRGYREVSSASPDVSFNVSGFKTPTVGDVRTNVGVVAWEGDQGLAGDQLFLQNKAISDVNTPANNAFNSRIANGGVYNTDRSPANNNNFGIDIKTFPLTNYLTNGSSSATVRLTSTGDVYYPGVVTLATELYAPAVSVQQSVVDNNGDTFRIGDTATYTLTATNAGPGQVERATGVKVQQVLSSEFDFVPGSLKIGTTPLADSAYNATARAITYDIGALNPNQSATLTYQARLNATGTHQEVLTPTPSVSFQSATTGQSFTGGVKGDPIKATLVVDVPSADLEVVGSILSPAIESGTGGEIEYQVVLTNNGYSTAENVVLSFDPPASGSIVGSSLVDGVCDGTTCAITKPLKSGESITGTVRVRLNSVTADTSASFSTSSSVADPNALNNKSVVPARVIYPPVVSDESFSTNINTTISGNVLNNDTDADGDTLRLSGIANPENGTATFTATGEVSYTPNTGFVGVDKVSYTVTDGTLTRTGVATFTVVAPKPTVSNDTAFSMGESVDIYVLANDTTPVPSGLTISPFSADTVATKEGGSVSIKTDKNGVQFVRYTPKAGFVGTDSFTYTATDKFGNVANGSVTVDTANGAPVISADPTETLAPFAAPSPITTTDPNGDKVVIGNVKGLPTGLSLGADGTWSGYALESGTFTVTFTACDSRDPSLCTDGSRVITVEAPAAPVGPFANVSITERVVPTNLTLPADTFIGDITGVPAGLALNADGTWTGTGAEAGVYLVEFNLCRTDSPTICTPSSFTLNVADLLAPSYTSTAQSVVRNSVAADLGTSDLGSIENVKGLPVGLTLNADGTWSGTASKAGVYTTTFDLCRVDYTDLCTSVSVEITVLELPTLVVDAKDETILTGAKPTNLTVPAGATLTGATNLPAGLTLSADGTWTGTATTPGTYKVSFQVCRDDAKDVCSTGGLTITVNAPYVPPVVAPEATITDQSILVNTAPKNLVIPVNAELRNITGLPAGLTLSPSGAWSGVASKAGVYTVKTDLCLTGQSTCRVKTFTITVKDLPKGVYGNQEVKVGSLAADLTLEKGMVLSNITGLPSGLSLDKSGHFTGVAEKVGVYPISMQTCLEDDATTCTSSTFTITVVPVSTPPVSPPVVNEPVQEPVVNTPPTSPPVAGPTSSPVVSPVAVPTALPTGNTPGNAPVRGTEGRLAYTGAEVGTSIGLGALLLVAGAFLMRAGRKRKH